METLRQFLADAWLNFRPADLLDIAFVAVALYFVLSWVRRRASAAVATGAFVLLGAYAAAEIFDLYMSSFMFKVGLTVLVFAFLLVFQDDIRRVFERLRIRALGERGDRSGDGKHLDAVVEAATRMAERSIGALIVIEGDEAIDVHTHGGVPVGGTVTVPLLLSLFQPESPAHDGAVTVKGGRIHKFGAHLPLSTDEDQVGEGGTRHAAALGLAERCDAAMVVVSEERGTISVAHDGRLERLSSSSELKTRLGEIYAASPSESQRSIWSRFFRENIGFKLFSVGLAILLWVTFAAQVSMSQRTLSAAIQYTNIPETLALERDAPSEAEVQLAGPQRAFDRLATDDIAISLDLSDRGPGEATFVLSGSDLDLPREMSVVTVDPVEIRVELFELIATTLPVSVALRETLPKGLELVDVASRPPEVDVYVRKSYIDQFEKLSTEPVDLSEMTSGTSTLEVALTPSRHLRWRGDFGGEVSVEISTRPTAVGDAGTPGETAD